MKREDIETWLYFDMPIENELRQYYKKNGSMMSENQFFRIAQKLHGVDLNVSDAFRNIDPSYIPENVSFAPSSRKNGFSDQLWLTKCSVSIRKHPCYFPELIHEHRFIEIAYVFKGSCRQKIYFENQKPEQIDLKEGELCILPPGLKHSISVTDESIVVNILIRSEIMQKKLTSLVAGNHILFDFFIYTLYENTLPNYIFFNTEKSDTIRNLIIDMMLELCENRMYSQKVIHLMLGLFFTYLQRDYSHTMRFSGQSGKGICYVPQIIAYMHENYQNTSVEDVVQHFHISKSYLSRIFKQHTKTTPVQMLQEIRLSHGCEFLENTQLSVQEIAYKTGYNDVTFFIRIFHKKYGVTPLQYRKQHFGGMTM
ncbi:AraC family transcriptional regulator [Blautia glucerasea]|uniref:AraC family transcriptional regulator n=1 Tax=Blautia glucerasea TaxID=536633 RepID=UPI001D02AD1B|nr:AraC family transcriptional regulator [Blautia glucerasea]MCB5387276.1 AraC family transcriptional regulator [Blautia glucerasea]MCB5421454.1 AraC family transcriptional regulator [Blautia luti]